MTDRLPLAQHTKASLDALYAELDRLTAELADYDERAEQQQARADNAEAANMRVAGLYEQWVKAGPPPLGASMARWWDARLVELREAIHEEADPAATEATERPTLRERHRAQWLALTDAERAARIAALDEDDEPEQPERTTPDNPPTSSDEADLTGYLAPDPPIGCLTVTTEPTPSQRPGLRGDITRTLREHGMVHLGDQVPADEYDCCSDAVLTLLYREWPWLRAAAEDAVPPSGS